MVASGKRPKTIPKTSKNASAKQKPKLKQQLSPELLSIISAATSAAHSFLHKNDIHLLPSQILSLESLLSRLPSPLPPPPPPPPSSSSFLSAFSSHPLWFRMSRDTFCHLLSLLSPALSSSLPSIPSDSALAAALFRLSHGASYKSLARRFAFPSSADACRVFYSVCKAINDHLGNLVELRGDLGSILVGFGLHSLPNCCGVLGFGKFDVDGLNGSLLVQALVDPQGRFLDISAGWPCSMKPESILHQTKLFFGVEGSRELLNGPVYKLSDGNLIPQYVLGDSCFPLLPWLITPYVRNNEEDSFGSAEKEFNAVHSRAMGLVGSAFGRVKARWQLLARRWKEECAQVFPFVIVTGCLLHNYLINRREPLPDDEVGFLEAEELPIFQGEVDDNGRRIRDMLAEQLTR